MPAVWSTVYRTYVLREFYDSPPGYHILRNFHFRTNKEANPPVLIGYQEILHNFSVCCSSSLANGLDPRQIEGSNLFSNALRKAICRY